MTRMYLLVFILFFILNIKRFLLFTENVLSSHCKLSNVSRQLKELLTELTKEKIIYSRVEHAVYTSYVLRRREK